MAIIKDEVLFYVTGNGTIHHVVATADERNGAVFINGKATNYQPMEMGTFHLFRTKRAADIAAELRRPVS
jgi:hypothetical protein